MNNRARIAIIVGGLLIVAVILAYILQNNSSDTTNTVVTNEVVNSQTVTPTNTDTNLSPTRELTEEEQQRIQIERLASTFIERFGTYNGSLSEENLNNTRDLMTDSFIVETEKNIVDNSTDDTVSILTTSLSVTITTFSLSDSAIVEAETLRQQTNSTDQTQNLISQKATIRATYTDGEWKVASSQWQQAVPIDAE